ncbi:hypothetical protein [Novosphingobium sediminicola]|uniref:Uncharacterized protein n=1 Tax=Novosphingobium sediminicola TaxID=563162 RepID=A0A7W6G858_9SPHN|nr:hypothetical protein [Novosphingobium sediminicola]MBB3956875.1 hypothetical protein [Novosphingobium sediminicola]
MKPYTITPTVIAGCTSIDLLHQWHGLFYAEFDRLVSEVEAAKIAGTHSDARFRGHEKSIMVCRLGMKNIERRVLALGEEPILTRDGHERRIIKRLRAEIEVLQMGRAA